MRVLSLFGTQWQAIKTAPVVKARAPGVASGIRVGGRHRGVLSAPGIRVDGDLDVVRPDQGSSEIFAILRHRLGQPARSRSTEGLNYWDKRIARRLSRDGFGIKRKAPRPLSFRLDREQLGEPVDLKAA